MSRLISCLRALSIQIALEGYLDCVLALEEL